MAKLQKLTTATTYIWHEAPLTDEQLKLYKEDEDAFWDEYGDDVEDEMDFVTDKPLSDDNEYTLIED